MAKPADICFVGDSLTEFWDHTGRPIRDLEFQNYRLVNLGIAGDRTEHVLYRLAQTPLVKNPPRLFVLMVGTNNLAMEPPDTPEAMVGAVSKIIDHLQAQCPTSRILLLTLPPNGLDPQSALRQRVLKANRLLLAMGQERGAPTLDVYSIAADNDDRWKPGLTEDGTHFSLKGYDMLGRALRPVVDELLHEP